MAKAIRSDLMDLPKWVELVKAAQKRGDAVHKEKCPTCEVQYAITLALMEDVEAAVKLLRARLRDECPEHQQDCYTIKGDLPGQIVPDISS
jgi:hypothetical protein